jgi:uncharacterized protein YjbI with pentapeptide repeats
MNALEQFLQCVAEGRRADNTDLRGAALRGETLRDAQMSTSRFDRADLTGTDWSSAVLRLCAFDAAQAQGACFDDARVEDSNFSAADLSGASFRSAGLSETVFDRALLQGAVFDDASGDGCSFRGADLRSASLMNTRFVDADFRGADLRGADLRDANVARADFRGALLEGARFDGSSCIGADFDTGAGPHAQSIATPARGDTAAAQEEFFSALQRDLQQRADVLPALMEQVFGRAGMAADRSGGDLSELLASLEPLLRQLEALSAGRSSVDQVRTELRKLSEDALMEFSRILPPQELERMLKAFVRDANAPTDRKSEKQP